MFISYDALANGPVVCNVGNSSVMFELTSPLSDTCLMKLSPSFYFTNTTEASIPVGTKFQLEYRGTVCEFWIGRRFVIRDA